jgi:UDP-glucuronate 4-epimerase
MDFINIIEREIGRKAIIKYLPMQKGDVQETFADIEETREAFGYDPKTNISEGLVKFISWYKDFHKTKKEMR